MISSSKVAKNKQTLLAKCQSDQLTLVIKVNLLKTFSSYFRIIIAS